MQPRLSLFTSSGHPRLTRRGRRRAAEARLIPLIYNVKSLLQRPLAAFTAIISVAAAVFVFACTEMLVRSVRSSSVSHGHATNVIILSRGSSLEATSRITENEARALDTYDELATVGGAAELVVTLRLKDETLTLRGITPASFNVRPYVHTSRPFRFGTDEVLIGTAVQPHLEESQILAGGTLRLRDAKAFPVAGTLDAEGAPLSNEVWMDLQTLRAFFADASALSAYTAHVKGSFETLKEHLAADARLDVEAVREQDYFNERSRGLGVVLQGIAIVLSVVILLGALLGAMAVMIALIRGRMREIGTMKAIGFERVHILRAFLIETMVIACMGGAIGIGGAWAMRFLRLGSLEGVAGELVAVAFVPTQTTIIASAALALLLGAGAGFIPAIFASRVSPMEAIRG